MASKIEKKFTHWMADHGIALLRISIGVIFLWFGVLKYFPGLSPIEDLSVRTARVLTFHLLPDRVLAVGLASLEVLIGIGLLSGKWLQAVLVLLLLQLIGAISPVFFFPRDVFNLVPFVPTLAGQYIIKDIVLISAGLVLGGTARGGQLVADPVVAEKAKDEEEQKLAREDGQQPRR
ncbi:DoxX family protein [Hymenobacter roseosalivarius DSM 11622]|uniref:DoxX family protein n=1 Tax=Hymenobacter roseosalivarius DSM 11622 TaxID=645990 RepID=A0A1W1UR99_9BACT|nr:DoxX family membrane protein [Hymenobacter roseosalivarius]SMB83539.1 DoxX family protein [Hymenobacter roseosalivarius DSM 11622]